MGGIKESGIGVRHGAEGIRKYCTRADDPAHAALDAARASRRCTRTRSSARSCGLLRPVPAGRGPDVAGAPRTPGRWPAPPRPAQRLSAGGRVEPGGERLRDQLEVLGGRGQRRRDRDARAELAHEHAGAPRAHRQAPDRAGVAREQLAGRCRSRPSSADAAAHLAGGRVVGERAQRVEQRLLELAPARDQALALEDLDVGERRRGARRVAGVGRAVAEDRVRRARARTARRRGRRRSRRRAAGSRS